MPLSERLHEKVLFVDSHAQKADWMTAAGGMLGIIGIGFGLWWADSVLAILISASIVYDGFTRTRDSMKDLLEETPMTTDNKNLHPLIDEVIETCLGHQWVADVKVRMREQGMFFFGDILVVPRDQACLVDRIAQLHSQVLALDWKIADLVISPVKDFSLLEHR